MSPDTVVGLLTLLGLLYLAWLQSEVRRTEAASRDADTMGSSAEAVRHMTSSLIEAVETLAGRDKLITELRARIEILEEHDRLKTARIVELERKLEHMEVERQRLVQERDALAARLTVQPGH